MKLDEKGKHYETQFKKCRIERKRLEEENKILVDGLKKYIDKSEIIRVLIKNEFKELDAILVEIARLKNLNNRGA